MTPRSVALVQDSFRKVAPHKTVVANLFYDSLFARDPALRALFRQTDMQAQGAKLIAALAFVVGGLSRPEAILPEAQALARRHVGYGVSEAHYATVGAALLDTLALGLGEAFTDEVRAAWAEAYALLSGVMIEAARETSRAA